MTPNESAAFLRSDEDDPDFLRDKPMGRCPWCGQHLITQWYDADRVETCPCGNYTNWNPWATELENRARYQEERMAEARVNERVNREVARGKDAPY
jgi:hypothetical protein